MSVKLERIPSQSILPPIHRGIPLEGVPYEFIEREGELAGKTALITGGTKGIGLAVAQGFAREGVNTLFVVSRNPALEAISKIATHGVEVIHLQADVSLQEDIEGIVDAVEAHLKGKKLDILVNNAGTTNDGRIQDHKREVVEQTYALNVFGGHMLVRGFRGKGILQKPGASIIYTASIAAEGNYYQSLYAGTKAAIIAEAQSLALELGQEGIRVNVVSPGLTDTDLTHDLVEKAKGMLDDLTPVAKGEQGVLKPEDLVPAFVFLASDQSFAVNGANLQVDQGLDGAYRAMFPLRKYIKPTGPQRIALAKLTT